MLKEKRQRGWQEEWIRYRRLQTSKVGTWLVGVLGASCGKCVCLGRLWSWGQPMAGLADGLGSSLLALTSQLLQVQSLLKLQNCILYQGQEAPKLARMGKVWQQAQCGNAKEMRPLKRYCVPAGMKRSSLVCTDFIKQALGGRFLSQSPVVWCVSTSGARQREIRGMAADAGVWFCSRTAVFLNLVCLRSCSSLNEK